MALTDLEIKRAKPRERPYNLLDGAGLYLTVTPSGGKLWRWDYRFARKEKLMSFGKYPDVPLLTARARHLEARQLLAEGIDPMADRKIKKLAGMTSQSSSFQAVAELWHKHWGANTTQRHADTTWRRMRANIFPTLGHLAIDSIKTTDVVATVKGLDKRGVPDLAKRSLQTVGQVFRYAIANGYAEKNPAAEIKPSDIIRIPARVNLARIEAKQLPALLRKIEIYDGRTVTRLAINLMGLTFPRTTELIGGEWSEIDFARARWDIPAERMKMKTPHIIPLSLQAVAVLRLLHHITGAGKLLFPGDRDPKRPMSNNTILMALKRMGYRGEMTGHGFRGLASTILHERGFQHEHIELQLAHMPRNAVSAAYNHALYLEQRTAMMQAWADYLDVERQNYGLDELLAIASPHGRGLVDGIGGRHPGSESDQAGSLGQRMILVN